ncbi:MAG: rod shape-determining protein MreD [Sphingomonas sp.]
MARVRGPFDPEPISVSFWLVPVASIIAGSMMTLVPFIAAFPILPPFGLMILVAWRLSRPDALPIWSPLAFGLFDDMISGQPLGSAMLLWTAVMLVVDLLDQRFIARDFWQDWLVASGAIGGCLLLGRFIAVPLAAPVDTLLLLQILLSLMLYPLATQLCAWLDTKRAI